MSTTSPAPPAPVAPIDNLPRIRAALRRHAGELDAPVPAAEPRDRHAVAVEDRVADHRGHARPGREDPDEVERIGRRDPAQLGGLAGVARGAQAVGGLGQRELLADEAGDEPPPRISPRASSRRSATTSSRHGGRLVSRATRSRNTTP